MKDSVVVIPTYNERENIRELLTELFSLYEDLSVLVVDDASPDGTADVVKDLQRLYPARLFLENRPAKDGLGRAYIHGFKWVLERDYRYIFQMDADFSHNPKDLALLWQAAIDGADVVVGSRYLTGISVLNWPLKRILLSYGASLYVRCITGMPIKDPTAGFVCYRRQVLEAINLDTVAFIGYAFQIEMKYKAYLKKFSIKEVSIVFKDRVKGHSKMSKDIIFEAVAGVIRMKIQAMRGRFSK